MKGNFHVPFLEEEERETALSYSTVRTPVENYTMRDSTCDEGHGAGRAGCGDGGAGRATMKKITYH